MAKLFGAVTGRPRGRPLNAMSVRQPGAVLATLAQRMWSALVDGLAISLWVAFVGLVQPWPAELPGVAKAAIWFLPPAVLEPVSIRTLGHTAGQGLVGLRVYSASGSPPTFARLLVRHLVKVALLGLSVFYVPFTNRRQALHDALFGTIVASGTVPLGSLPPLEPIKLSRFVVALVLASVSSLALGVLLGFAFELATAAAPPSEFSTALFGFFATIAMAVAFLEVVVRQGRRARRPAE